MGGSGLARSDPFRTSQGCPRTVGATGEAGEESLGPSACRTPSGPNPEAMPPWRPNVLGAPAGPRPGAPRGCGETPLGRAAQGSAAGAASGELPDFGLPHRVPRKRRCRALDRDPERW